jgi:hypothetical protein
VGENHFDFIKKPLPNEIRVVSIVGTHLNPLRGHKINNTIIKTLWGEIGFQLDGEKGYEIFKDNDQSQIAPGRNLIRKLFQEDIPSVILIDELTAYITKAKGIRVGDSNLGIQTLVFLQELTECLISIKKSILLITLPDKEYESASDGNDTSTINIHQILSRVASTAVPSNRDEIYKIIQKKLIKRILKPLALKEVISNFYDEYIKNDNFPLSSTSHEYITIMESSYPFHPALIDIFSDLWAQMPAFQGTRSILSLLAAVLNEMKKGRYSNTIILPSDIDFEVKSLITSFLRYISPSDHEILRKELSLLNSVLKKYSFETKEITGSILKTIFLASLPLNIPSEGISVSSINLSVWKPNLPLSLVEETLKSLKNNLKYLHCLDNKYFLSEKLNYNAKIQDLKFNFAENAITKIEERIHFLFEKSELKTIIWPNGPHMIEDGTSLKIILLKTPISDEIILSNWIQYIGNKRFRMYKNTLIFGILDNDNYERLLDLYQTQYAIQFLLDSSLSVSINENSEETNIFKDKIQELGEGISYLERRLYSIFFDGVKRFQLKSPEKKRGLPEWLYEELMNKDIIVNNISPRLLLDEFIGKKEKIHPKTIVEQFSKTLHLPKPINKQIIIKSIIRGIKNHDFSLIRKLNSKYELIDDDKFGLIDSDSVLNSNIDFLVEINKFAKFLNGDNFKIREKKEKDIPADKRQKVTLKLQFDKTGSDIFSSLQNTLLNPIKAKIDSLNLQINIQMKNLEDNFEFAIIEEIVEQLGGKIIHERK